MLPCASVVHDLQKNVYFRIDKTTGLVARSHKNGELIKFFKVDVTGNDYKIRKQIERTSLKLKKPVNYSNKAIRKESFSPKNISPRMTSQKELTLLSGSRLKSQQLESNFLTNFQTITDIPLKKDYSHMGTLLKHYEKLSQKKIFDNHSRIGKETGTLLNLKHDYSKGFRETKNMIYQPFASIDRSYRKSIRTINENPVPRQDWKQKIIREKQRFLECNYESIQSILATQNNKTPDYLKNKQIVKQTLKNYKVSSSTNLLKQLVKFINEKHLSKINSYHQINIYILVII